MSNRRLAGLAGLLAGIGLLVAAKAAGGQPAHQQVALLPAAAPPTTQPSTQGAPQPTGGTTAAQPPVPAGPHTVDGSVVDTPYGPVQVAVVFDNGKIVDVQNKQTPDIGGRSARLAELATPILRQEVLSAQSAHVDSVSGATYTSDGYAQSVQYAIDHH
ncbi:MAG TPA: FMN-binding protein [Pseudonocardiaceae bacterium]